MKRLTAREREVENAQLGGWAVWRIEVAGTAALGVGRFYNDPGTFVKLTCLQSGFWTRRQALMARDKLL